jgi:Phage integrase, N-terminal SAM-like domain
MASPVPDFRPGPAPQPPRLLDQLRQTAFTRFGRPEPGDRYADWAHRYILFHGKRHPRELGAGEVGRFLEHIAQSEKDPLRCLEQAHEALTFLYKDLLHLTLGELPLPQPPRLLDRVRHAIRVRHYSPRTEECYVEWATRFIRFHGLRHPNTMGGPEIEMFLTDLAVKGHVGRARRIRHSAPCCSCTRMFSASSCLGWTRCEHGGPSACRRC